VRIPLHRRRRQRPGAGRPATLPSGPALRRGDADLPPATLARTLRTVSHLEPAQIWHRLRLRTRRAIWQRRGERIDARYRARAARLGPADFGHAGLAAVAALRARLRDGTTAIATAREIVAGRFTFLGRSESFGREVEWFRPDLDAGTRLWKTHLHEFPYADDLARASQATGDPIYRERLLALARSWRAAAPIGCPGFALDAWNGRAVATRLVHWAVAASRLGLRPGDPDADWLGAELATHALFLRDNLELDLGGNHLFRDAVGLVFAHELVGGVPDALAWLERQVAEQILPDGGHFERAPMYHAICLQDLLETRLLLGEAAPAWLDDALARMTGFLEAIRLGDGDIPLLGDAWLGERNVPVLVEAARALVEPRPPATPERHSGLVPLHAGTLRAVVRAGPHGPDHQLGHAHADLLSFDLSVGSRRAVTDAGTHLYDPGPERDRLRATPAHNTLRLDGVEQIEAWGSFRVGRRGRARAHARGRTGDWSWLSASHDAYRFLPGRPIHHRLVAVGKRAVIVLDAVLGGGHHRIESHLNQHPERPEGIRIAALGGGASEREASLHERFGETRQMIQLVTTAETELPWCGGWWITTDPEMAPPVADLAAPLPLRDGALVLEDAGLSLTWRPGTAGPGALSLCSVDRGSAK
jgi:uncharacterized heparinase superfamily protein